MEYLIMKLNNKIQHMTNFESINSILTATVPVIKLVIILVIITQTIDPTKVLLDKELEEFKNIKESNIYKEFKFDKEEMDKVKVDITFIEITGVTNQAKLAVEYAILQTSNFPEIKPIIHVLKRFLYHWNLNSSFNGTFIFLYQVDFLHTAYF